MRSSFVAAVLACGCSTGPDAPKAAAAPPPVTATDNQPADPGINPKPSTGSDNIMPTNSNTPGGTGVDEHGVLIRSKPDPNAPKPDPALAGDNDANMLFYAASAVGDPAVQRRAWIQLGLVDAKGTPTAKMTDFLRAHNAWLDAHGDLAATVGTPDKAKTYLASRLK
jgi:hypothetical protein